MARLLLELPEMRELFEASERGRELLRQVDAILAAASPFAPGVAALARLAERDPVAKAVLPFAHHVVEMYRSQLEILELLGAEARKAIDDVRRAEKERAAEP